MQICDSVKQSGINEGGEEECGSCERGKEKPDNKIKEEITRTKRGMWNVLGDFDTEAAGMMLKEEREGGNGNAKWARKRNEQAGRMDEGRPS